MENKVLERETDLGPGSSGGAVERAALRSLAGRRLAYEAEIQRLMEAAFVLIQRTGALEPRVGEIVREAGLSNQAFYRHFRSKHELLVAVLDRGVELLASYLGHRMAAASGPAERVRAWLEGLLAQALDPGAAEATRPFALARGRLVELYPMEVAESERRVMGLVEGALRDARAMGELPGVEPERDAESLYHLAMGWMQARLLEGGAADEADAERLVAFAFRGLERP
jgi:AcrR family transcriptional regulator